MSQLNTHTPSEHLPIYVSSEETTHPASAEERVSAILAQCLFLCSHFHHFFAYHSASSLMLCFAFPRWIRWVKKRSEHIYSNPLFA